MEVVTPDTDTTWRHPTRLELVAGILLALTVILHVVAMFPAYFAAPAGHSSLFSQADEAASYSILAAGWALALVIGLTGPSRIPISAGLATGLAATELGFRVSDIGAIIRYGSNLAGAGLWIMVAAWVVGAVAAGLLVVAARWRRQRMAGAPPEIAAEQELGWESASPGSLLGSESHGRADAGDAEAPALAPSTTEPVGSTADGSTASLLWTALLGGLGLITAIFFLPSWDHYVGVSTSTGRAFSFNLGNAFSGPWEVVLGNVLVAIALVAIPLVGSRLRDRGAVAAAVGGSLIVLASQFVSAVVQVDEPVSLTSVPAKYLEQGSQFGIKLTGWFTVDVLAAFALFSATMVWATSRVVYANSRGTVPNAPELRSEAISSAS
jgi:hypothetical protein